MIVGGTGFVGGHLAEYFFKEGEISKGIFRKGSHLRIMDQCGIQCIEADVMDRHTLHEPLDMVDVVYDLASPPPGAGAEEYAKFNTVALNNLLEEANEHGAKVFVYLSCLDVYGSGPIEAGVSPRPRDDYQKAKLEAEKIVSDFGREKPDMKVRIVRAARAIGPRDTTLTVPLLKMVERGKVILPAGANAAISFSHPKDIAQSLLKAATYVGDLETCMVKSFDATTENYAKALSNATGKKAEVKSAGLFSGKTLLPTYTTEQIRAGLVLKQQETWNKISYMPAYTIEKTADEVSEWNRKEPWSTQDQA